MSSSKSLALLLFFSIFSILHTHAQTTVSGKVIDSTSGNPLAGVSILVKDKLTGTTTTQEGKFSLTVKESSATLVFSFIGYRTQEISVNSTAALNIQLAEQTIPGQEVVVSASRTREGLLQSPVSIEKLNSLGITASPSYDFYRSLGNLKGVDMVQSSLNYPIFNARGFNATGNTRMIQLLDGVDLQVPGLNLAAGNLFGPSELDIESMEFLPGASSALYGPNAFNGIILQTTKNPFQYQGLSASVKYGINHIDDADLNAAGKGKTGPGSAQSLYEVSLRYAKAFKDRFAFKIAGSWSQGTDWFGTNFEDRAARTRPAGFSFNPGSDLLFAAGDEVATSMGLVKLQLAGNPAFMGSPLAPFLQFLPDHVVSRTPYEEFNFVDYDQYNVRFNTALHYRLTQQLEVSYNFNYGKIASVINGAQRTPVRGFSMQQHKVELKSPVFFLRAYASLPETGDVYSGDLTGVLINNAWKPHAQWFQQYAIQYLTFLAGQSGQPEFDPMTIATQQAAHQSARGIADVGRLIPGTPAFEEARQKVISSTIPNGSRIEDNTRMYHAEGQYDFKNLVKVVALQVGASYRLFDLNSKGTLFADTAGNNITVQEIGAYLQASKKLLRDKLKLTGSLRFDKNENFDAQLNPRIAAVYSPSRDHHFRMSLQTGFRNPTLQGQHVDFNAVSLRLLGGLPQYAAAHKAYENAFLLSSVQKFITEVSKAATPGAIGNPANLDLLVPVTGFTPVKPEKVQAFEVGYKTILWNSLLIDVSYYYNQYKDFIAQRVVRKAAAPIDLDTNAVTPGNVAAAQSLLSPIVTPGKENTFSIYTNVDKKISSQGFAAGVEYRLPRHFTIAANYNWNKLNEDLGESFTADFNTPEHKFNVMFGNRKLTERIGFNIAFRWQSAFLWESSFVVGEVPAFGVTDMQVSYSLKKLKSIIKIGGSDIFNKRYVSNAGAPTIGAVYYVQVTFDEML
jgi:iron complex outermembrane receptor protein